MFADFFVILFAAHHLSDFPLQTDRQSARKAGWVEGPSGPYPGRHHHGWGPNLAHAGTHVAVSAVLLWLAVLVLGLHASVPGAAAALAWVGFSHSLIDRRVGVYWWMEHTGQAGYLANGGAEKVDQAAHLALGLLPAAVMLTKL